MNRARQQLKPLKFIVSQIGSGNTPKGGADSSISEGVMLIRSQDVHDSWRAFQR